MTNFDQFTCPIPISEYPQVLLAHGGGGKLMNMLITKMFRASFPDVAERILEMFSGEQLPRIC